MRWFALLLLCVGCSEGTEGASGDGGHLDPDDGVLMDPDDGVRLDPDDGIFQVPDAAADPDDGVPPEPACPTETQQFEAIWQDFMGRTCAACHIAGGVARDSRFQLVGPEVADWVAINLATLRPLAVEDAVEGRGDLSLLFAKPTDQHPDGHGGGPILNVGSSEADALRLLALRLRGETDACGVPIGPDQPPAVDCEEPPLNRRLLRRLAHPEYANAVRDLLGVEFDAAAALTADSVVHGFDNNAEALQVSALLADQYRTAAESLAEQVQLARVVPCAAEDRACASEFVRTFGRRIFRRPLTGAEAGGYLEIFDLAAPDGFEAGVRWILVAMLQSPHFLYRTELGRRTDAGFELTPFEIATELSFLLWQTTPSDALLERAANGDLLDPEVVRTVADEMLLDPQSAVVMNRFVDQWVGLDRLPIVTRDAEIYPELTAALRAAMAEETSRFVTGLWQGGGTFADLMSARHSWLNAELGAHYGVPAEGGFAEVSLEGTPYGGLLTHASVLTTYALPTGSSPIHRGLFVRERLLCQPLPPPPANLDTSPPEVDPGLSTRDRYTQHSEDEACRGCHTLIDPIGFAFENFDGIGRWRDREGENDIDASGAITGTSASDLEFVGVQALAAALAASPDAKACYAEQWVRYGYGIEAPDCLAEGLDEGALQALPRSMTGARHFYARRGEMGEMDVPGAELVPTEPGEPVEPPDVVDPPPPDPPVGPADGVALVLVEVSRWQTGYCADGTVTNSGDEDVAWVVEGDVEGTINNIWNAEADGDSGRVHFSGVAWNAVVGPGQSAAFGFCAEL